MKNLINYIKESAIDINKYYKKISDFKDGENIILGWIDEDNYAEPYNVIVKKKGNETLFVNPDDENDVIDWHEFINTTDNDEKNPQVAWSNSVSKMQKVCDYYNDIADM